MAVLRGYDVYRLYVALKTHFRSETYDFFKSKGRIRANRSSFERRRDRYFFDRLARRFSGRDSFELIDFFVANLSANADVWVGNMMSDQCEQTYLDWCRRIQSLDYIFQCDCETLLNEIETEEVPFNDLFVSNDKQHPLLLRMVMREQINVESFIILENMLHFFDRWDKQMPGDYVLEEYKLKCQKYRPFMTQINDSKRKHRSTMRQKLVDRGLLS